MDRKMFCTLVKNDIAKWDNDFVLGKIVGIQDLVCGSTYPMRHVENGMIVPVKCSQEVYDIFTKHVEKRYPGLCEFDFQFEVE